MSKYLFTYTQLEETYQSLMLGDIEPNIIKMGPDTYAQFHVWIGGRTIGGIPIAHPEGGLWLNGASVQPSPHIPEGHVVFIGGVHVMKIKEL